MFQFKRILVCSIVAVFAIAVPAFAQRGERDGGVNVRGIVKAVDAKAGTITITTGGGREEAHAEKTYSLAKNAEICVTAGGGLRAGGVFKEAKLGDIAAGTIVGLSLVGENKLVDGIIAEEPTVRGVLKSVDAQKRTLTVATTVAFGREQPAQDKESTYTVAADAEITVDDGRGKRHSIHEGKLEDLAPGAIVAIRVSLDKKSATAVMAEGSTILGTVKEIDPAKRTMKVTTRTRDGQNEEDHVVSIAKEAMVLVDDGRGKRLSVKEGKLADIPVGAFVSARYGADQGFVMLLKAEGPTLTGFLKAIDTEKNAVTIGIQKTREEVEEKTYFLAKDGRVNVDGKDGTIADLKVGDNGPMIQLRLSLDQRTAQSVIARKSERRE